jgi:hypothetical protein
MTPLAMTRLYDFACAKRRAISAPVAFHTPRVPADMRQRRIDGMGHAGQIGWMAIAMTRADSAPSR